MKNANGASTGEVILGLAVENNVDLCDLVCRANGLSPVRTPTSWTSAVRTPDLYPDAITLSVDATSESVLSLIDQSAGCSIKDSFATLDLHPYGFSVLFEATWIGLSGTSRNTSHAVPDIVWSVLRNHTDFTEWIAAWGQTNFSKALTPQLLGDPAIDVLCARHTGHVLGGAIVNRSENAAGLSNFFAPESGTLDFWKSCITAVRTLVSELPVVGYVSNANVGLAKNSGFRSLGPLRVWVK